MIIMEAIATIIFTVFPLHYDMCTNAEEISLRFHEVQMNVQLLHHIYYHDHYNNNNNNCCHNYKNCNRIIAIILLQL